MANRIVPTKKEIRLTDNDLLISKTDSKGYITYCNRTFMRISGYSEKELLNTQHSVIRHPDMPRGVYRHLWQTLEQSKEYFGYLKNLSSDGSYYWVFTHITPDHDPDRTLHGYHSVRRKARQSSIAIIEPIYKEMLAIEQREHRTKGPDLSLAYMHEKLNEFSIDYEHFVLHI